MRNIIYEMLRKRYLWYFNRDYVLQGLSERRGYCNKCGECCKTVKCPFVGPYKLCKKYDSLGIFCKLYPFDQKAIRLSGVEDKCSYYWDE